MKTWNTLNNLKKTNETFNDVILYLLKERTQSAEKGNLKALKYQRKTLFLETTYKDKPVSVEFEYNDVKEEQTNFTLDLTFRKVFLGRRIFNPSEFFGVNKQHKHLHPAYLGIYFRCVSVALCKEFKTLDPMVRDDDFENIARWRKFYYDHSLSEESFINDVEEPLRLSEEEKISLSIKEKIKSSPSNSIWKIIP
jgi:hypothetical protein